MKSMFNSGKSGVGLLAATFLVPALAFGAFALPSAHTTTHAAAARVAMRRIIVHAANPHLPSAVAAGVVALTLIDDTKADADASLGRANPGAKLAEIQAASNSNSMAGFVRLTHLLTFLGGPGSVHAGGSETAILDLRTPGQYGLNISRADGLSSNVLFKVIPGPGQHDMLPAAGYTINVKNMRFLDVPARFKAGITTFQLTNQSKWVHEMVVARLDPGKTIQDVKNALKSPTAGNGPPPAWVHQVGGLNSLSGKQTASVALKLTPGYYVLICFMPDVSKNGMPHAVEGMYAHFTVR